MRNRRIGASVLLVIAAGLAVLGASTHYSLAAEYGMVGLGGPAVILVVLIAGLAFWLSSDRWMRWTAVAISVLMLVATLAVTPLALGKKSEQYDAVPQCASPDSGGMAPDAQRAVQQAQQAFESIEHVGRFGGGGRMGLDGCERRAEVGADVDLLQHYRAALPEAGWRIVTDEASHLRAERDGMAFEVIPCPGGGLVWAGSDAVVAGSRCDSAH